MDVQRIQALIEPHKQADKQFYLDLLDGDKQRAYENEHVCAVLAMLKYVYINKLKAQIAQAEGEKQSLTQGEDYRAEQYRRVLGLNAVIATLKEKVNGYKCFFEEPYFARMDVVDEKEGYNSYYIGKRGDERLEIVDWRAPLARRYYQKSKLSFDINDYHYQVVLRRALRTQNGKVLDFKNEYLSVKEHLTPEEIDGRDEAAIFDPFLKEILKTRKEKQEITDIIETIQEKQYEIITLPENEEFAVQGVAGSGKTMILLHRLSYLMYNNDSLRPENVLVITPSDSFNAFIDELSAVLELEKVKTSTLNAYFLRLLKGVDIDLSKKIDATQSLPQSYLSYIYSADFGADVQRRLHRVYDGIFGMFAGEDCQEFILDVLQACKQQLAEYEFIKNASLRVRRQVLGEIKEKKDGGLYYTKSFRALFNAVIDVREFLTLIAEDARMQNHAYFYRQLLSFYRSVKMIRAGADKVCAQAVEDLHTLSNVVEREIVDLKRYKLNRGSENEVLTYADRIEHRKQTLKEIEATICRIERISALFAATCDLAEVLRGNAYFTKVGKCENVHDVALFFYREIVAKEKKKAGLNAKIMNVTDPYALCFVLTQLGYDLSPKYSYVFVDEAQDLSQNEYSVLRAVNANAKFNVFGDIGQNVTPWRGVDSWQNLGFPVYTLNRNYRNTNQIVHYVARHLGTDMKPIGFDGSEVVSLSPKQINEFFADKNGLKAIITSAENLPQYAKRGYSVLRQAGAISKSKINVMTVYESKGLEFTAVAVVDGDLSNNEKYIAYTRALRDLAIVR